MKHIGLFEGIGGFSLAAKWMGWETVAWCEINPFGQQVLKHHYPGAEGFGDIKITDFTKYANKIDILTGGFPCQPYSLAGKRKGKEDERHLWPEMLRAIKEIQPRWVVGENVFGLINWSGGLVFHEVQADLEAAGYEVWAYVLPACAVNAPHRRDRVWFVAHRNNAGDNTPTSGVNANRSEIISQREQSQSEHCGYCNEGITKNTNSNGRLSNIGQEKSGIGQFGNACTRDNERIQTNDGEIRVTTNTLSSTTGSPGACSCITCNGSRNDTQPQERGTETKQHIGCSNVSEVNPNSESWGERRVRNKNEAAGPQQSNISLGSICRVSSTPNPNSDGQYGSNCKHEVNASKGGQYAQHDIEQVCTAPDPNSKRQPSKEHRETESGRVAEKSIPENWANFPTQPPICGRNDGISAELFGITISKHRNESIKAYGNAIVPQVAHQIFKAIQQYENIHESKI